MGDNVVASLPRYSLGKITAKHKLEILMGIKEVRVRVGSEGRGSGRGNCTYKVLRTFLHSQEMTSPVMLPEHEVQG